MEPMACSVTKALFCTTNLRVRKMSCSTEVLIIWSSFLTRLQAYSSSEFLNITTSLPPKDGPPKNFGTLQARFESWAVSKRSTFWGFQSWSHFVRRGQDMVIVSSSSLVFGASWKETAAGLYPNQKVWEISHDVRVLLWHTAALHD